MRKVQSESVSGGSESEEEGARSRLLGIRRRVPDTTLRDALEMVEPGDMRQPLHAIIRAAHRRKALSPNARRQALQHSEL